MIKHNILLKSGEQEKEENATVRRSTHVLEKKKNKNTFERKNKKKRNLIL